MPEAYSKTESVSSKSSTGYRLITTQDLPTWISWALALGKTLPQLEAFYQDRQHWTFFDKDGIILFAHLLKDESKASVDVVFNKDASRRRIASALALSMLAAKSEGIKTLVFESTAQKLIGFLSKLAPVSVTNEVVSVEVN